MTSLKEKLKEIIRKQLPVNVEGSKYRIGLVTKLNDSSKSDPNTKTGTCQVSIDGVSIEAFPLYPVVLGQEVVAIFGAGGKISAVPTRPNAPAVDIILPPFYSGGRYRLLAQTYSTDLDNINVQFRFQDLGSPNTFVTDLGSFFTMPVNPVLSPNGQYLTYVKLIPGEQYEIHSLQIGPALTAPDPPIPIDKDRKVFTLKTPKEITSFTGPTRTLFSDPGLDTDGILRSDFTVMDIWVDNSGVLYWMELQVDTWSITFNQGQSTSTTLPLRALTVVRNAFVRIFKLDGVLKTTIVDMSLMSVSIIKTIRPSGAADITLHFTSNSPIPLTMADPTQGLIFASVPDAAVMFDGTSYNLQIVDLNQPPPFRGGANNIDFALPPGPAPGIFSQDPRPAIIDKDGNVLISNFGGKLGHSATGNHIDSNPIGAELFNPSHSAAGGGTFRYLPSVVSNFHRMTVTTSKCVWWIDDTTLNIFGFKISTKKVGDAVVPVLIKFSVTNSITDLAMDLSIGNGVTSDFRSFMADVFPFNHLMIDGIPGWVECGGTEPTHTFLSETSRHVRKLSLKSDSTDPNNDSLPRTVVIVSEDKHQKNISPSDPGGYPAGVGGVTLPVLPDDDQWRLLYDPADVLNEFLYSVAIVQ